MSLFAATFFAFSLALSLYAMVSIVAQKWDRIVAVTVSQGEPAQRVIRLGEQRYTGARLRVVGGSSATDPWGGALVLHEQGELKLAA